MKLNIHFEPKWIRINGTITVTDEEDNIIDEYKQSFDYTVAAGLLEESDVEWIKEYVNEEDSEETQVNQ